MESERDRGAAGARQRIAATDEGRPNDALEALKRFDTEAVVSKVTAFARENPHAALAAAAGVGFLLGGGLTPRIVGAVALFAGRRYVGEAIRDAVDSAVSAHVKQP